MKIEVYNEKTGGLSVMATYSGAKMCKLQHFGKQNPIARRKSFGIVKGAGHSTDSGISAITKIAR